MPFSDFFSKDEEIKREVSGYASYSKEEIEAIRDAVKPRLAQRKPGKRFGYFSKRLHEKNGSNGLHGLVKSS